MHKIRASLRDESSKHHKGLILELKAVYHAPSLEPAAIFSWRTNWANLSTYFSFSQEIRKRIYTTNAVETLHRQFRKVTKAKSSFPTDDALKKRIYLATQDRNAKHKQGWALKLIFPERVPKYGDELIGRRDLIRANSRGLQKCHTNN